MSLSDYYENKAIDHLFRNQAFTPPATVYGSLHTADPGDTGANEATGAPYGRIVVSLGAAAAGLTDNTALLEWSLPVIGGDGVVAVGLWDAITSGNFLGGGWLSTVKRAFVCTDVAGDVIASPAHGFANNDRVVVEAEYVGSLPTGLAAGTIYFVVGSAADTFQVSATQGGAAVNITAVGSGIARKVTPRPIAVSGDKIQFAVGDLDLIVR